MIGVVHLSSFMIQGKCVCRVKEFKKRNKVYKAVNDIGYISEMKQQTPAVLENG